MSALDTQVAGEHYKKYKIQPMEYSMANGLDACQHTAIKYITRFRDKGGIEDLEKAKHSIDMLIEFERQAIAQASGIPKDFVPYKYGDAGPSVGTIVDVIYVSNEVEQNKIIGQFSWSEVKGYKVRFGPPAPLPITIPECVRPPKSRFCSEPACTNSPYADSDKCTYHQFDGH